MTDNQATSTENSDKQARKQEQASRDRKAARKEKLKPLLKLAGISLGVLVFLGGLIYLGELQDSPSQPSPLSSQVTSVDHAQGPETAAVTLVEYADFQCPTCAAFAPVLERLVEEYPDDLRFVYRFFPLQSIHPNATIAAEAAEAAGLQGKFWEMHDLLFDRQSEWNSVNNPKDLFTDYAQTLGLNTEQFKNDLGSQVVKDRVQADLQSATSANLSGTPTFFVNGRQLKDTPRGFEALKAIVEAELQK